MSKIDQQIKALQLKKTKIDYVKYIEDLLKNDTKCVDFKHVKEEILSQIIPHLEKVAEAIENDSQVQESSSLIFSKEQSEVLKELADKFMAAKQNKNPQQESKPQNQPYQSDQAPVPAPKKQELSHNDKMNFAMNNRHLANKRVQVMNDQNVQIHGLVVGLDAPYVQVKTDTGPTINVPLEKVSMI